MSTMSFLQAWLLVTLGSAVGGGARLWLATAVSRPLGTAFPWGTLAVNLLGCLCVGALGALLAPPGRLHDAQTLRVFLVVGVLGGFTTFSAFALDTLILVQRGASGPALAYVLTSVLGCLAAAGVSYTAVSSVLR
jgi:CrcB protein